MQIHSTSRSQVVVHCPLQQLAVRGRFSWKSVHISRIKQGNFLVINKCTLAKDINNVCIQRLKISINIKMVSPLFLSGNIFCLLLSAADDQFRSIPRLFVERIRTYRLFLFIRWGATSEVCLSESATKLSYTATIEKCFIRELHTYMYTICLLSIWLNETYNKSICVQMIFSLTRLAIFFSF